MAAPLDLRQIRTFIQVARTGSFTKAASRLYYAQSSVTAQVQALERDLGLPLFNRLGRHVELTETGRQFLGYAEELMCLAEEARLSVQKNGSIAGPLAISVAESLLTYRLPELLKDFQATYPDVQLVLHTGGSCSSMAPLEPGIDLGITMDEPVAAPQLLVQKLRKERMVSVVAAEHTLSKRRSISASEIAGEQFLLTEHGCSYRALFERTLAAEGERVNKLLEFSSVEALKQCAIARMGVAVLPEIVVAEELKRGILVALPWPKQRLHVYTQLVRHRYKWFSPAISAFWSMATRMLRESAE